MPIDPAQVEHIAALARIALSNAEKEAFARQLSDILDQFEALQSLDTTGVEPTSHVAGLDTVLRDDEPTASLDVEDTLRNAPLRRADFFQVRAVLEE
jgi:aspartyl-tRNA(Asn)/glutamyl-tRNA(Gln) amidotransferase subunit C